MAAAPRIVSFVTVMVKLSGFVNRTAPPHSPDQELPSVPESYWMTSPLAVATPAARIAAANRNTALLLLIVGLLPSESRAIGPAA